MKAKPDLRGHFNVMHLIQVYFLHRHFVRVFNLLHLQTQKLSLLCSVNVCEHKSVCLHQNIITSI